MILPNKILIVVFAVAIVAEASSIVQQMSFTNFLWVLGMSLPVIIALTGHGGKIVYVAALLVSWLLAGLLVVALPFEIYLDYFAEQSQDSPEPLDLEGALLIFAIGFIGIATHYCITRTHPVATKTILSREVNSLFIGTMQRQAFMFGANVVLLALITEAAWTFSDVIVIYWYETVLISVFSAWTIKQLNLFDTSEPRFACKTVEEVRDEFVTSQLQVYCMFYGIYFLIILLMADLPNLADAGYILVLAVAYFMSHYYEAQDNVRELRSKPVSLKRIENKNAWRILPMHLTFMLAIIALGDDHPGPAILFVMLKAIIDVVREVSEYRHLKSTVVDKFAKKRTPTGRGKMASTSTSPALRY